MIQHNYPRGCFFEKIEDICNKRITIMGLGLNGGGLAAARFFLQHKAHVIVTDMKTNEKLAKSVNELEQDKSFDHALLTFHLGNHEIDDFENVDCIIKNPGVKFEGNKFLDAASKKGVSIETDISVFLHFCHSPIIAVTGSKGKSSTVSAIYHSLCECGFSAFLGGNITVSPLTFLDKTKEDTPVVLELSSWQLADLRGRGVLKPKVSIITKIVPDHMNWYGNMEDYVADKKLIYADQTKDDFAIFDFSEADKDASPVGEKSWGNVFANETKAKVINPNQIDIVLPKLKVPGEHNKINALNAVAALCAMGISKDSALAAIATWQGIQHRLQYFHTWRNIRFYNDSAATVPEAAAAALNAFNENIIFITGGTDKGLSFEYLAAALAEKSIEKNCEKNQSFTTKTSDSKKNCETHFVKLYLLKGSGTDKLVQLLDEKNIKHEKPFDDLRLLLKSIYENEKSNNSKDTVVVFSPGATSFGMFQNEFDRGCKFMEIVKEIFV